MSNFIVIDKNDTASMNIMDKLINEQKVFMKTSLVFKEEPVYFYKNTYLVINDEHSAEAEKIDDAIENITAVKPEMIIFPTVHASQSEIPSLTVHTPGNWGDADEGGLNRKLCISAEAFMKEALRHMETRVKEYPEIKDFDIIQEATHHGPALSCPSMFIEIGSTKKEWKIEDAGRVIADTIVYLIESTEHIANTEYETAVGIGGPHSCTNFMKITFNDERIAIGHVCPKHSIGLLDKQMLEHAMQRCSRDVRHVIVDWKGLGQEKERIISLLDDMGIEYKRTKDFKYNS